MAARAIAPSERVLVPSGPTYRRLVGSTPVLLGALAALLVARNGLVGIMAASVVALTLAGIAQFLRRERVTVTATHIVSRRPIGWPRKRRLDDVATVVSVRLRSGSGRRAYRNLLVLDQRERLIARLAGPRWTPADMRRLVAWLGARPEELDQPVSARALGARFPRAVPLRERFPVLYGLAAGGALAAGIVVIASVTG